MLWKWNRILSQSFTHDNISIIYEKSPSPEIGGGLFFVFRCNAPFGVTYYSVLRTIRCYVLFGVTYYSVLRTIRCHPREGGDPEQQTLNYLKYWIPAFAGMTSRGFIVLRLTYRILESSNSPRALLV